MRVLNWKPSFKNHLDLNYEVTESLPLPTAVTLRAECPPVMNQGQMGSCTGNALAGLFNFMKLKVGLIFAASRLFIYYNERLKENSVLEDAGATTMRDGLVSLYAWGVCPEKSWPYTLDDLFPKPGPTIYHEAEGYKIKSFKKLQTMVDRQHCLASGKPFVFGIPVYSSFESNSTAQSGLIPMPGWLDSLLGGHALLCVGYDDEKKLYMFMNSWGDTWGDEGFGYLPYQYMEKMASDCWTFDL